MIAENWKKSGMDVTPKFIKGPEILSKMVGETERAIRDIFKPASGIED
jgi:SpoVK/Ycf46/Vps4 family AAA+-type ATPase